MPLQWRSCSPQAVQNFPPIPPYFNVDGGGFVFCHPFGEELQINIEDGGAGGERMRNMRVTHLATPAFLDLHGTHETVQPPFTDPRPALMQTIAWHGTPAKLAINSKQGRRSAPPTCPTKDSNYYGTLTVMGYTPAIPACCRRSLLKQDAQNGNLHAGLATRFANR